MSITRRRNAPTIYAHIPIKKVKEKPYDTLKNRAAVVAIVPAAPLIAYINVAYSRVISFFIFSIAFGNGIPIITERGIMAATHAARRTLNDDAEIVKEILKAMAIQQYNSRYSHCLEYFFNYFAASSFNVRLAAK